MQMNDLEAPKRTSLSRAAHVEAGSSGSSDEPSCLLVGCGVDGRQLDCDVFRGGEEQSLFYSPLTLLSCVV